MLTDDQTRSAAYRSSRRNPTPVAWLRWKLMPWWAFAWRFLDDFGDAPNPGHWWDWCIGSTTWWLDKLLARLPGGDLFPPMPVIVCDCDYCRGVPGARFEP